ncbi:hypothetical protein BCR33DRAFT_720711 [Rhizoclosmatium globosum]|uniref:LIM zinc-binding domain-containing protein n=1 Tax=Rhizoclosmatium globosum TaxID=329046 RepID=A0A1Y2BUC0_9FUNG|nr:Filamin-binding LIM protein 1 [Rhizoclosmatium hyalinum]ORY38346.1 hypothetical protein BCR33DRAFT_720711 [Rhizoclosmatium globosum]|eukprot:ORY38346.1 hypothetical protein BCR33DRAFT_720711 [Rhizoclosmatium globosum]
MAADQTTPAPSAATAAAKVGEILRKHELDLTMVENPEFRGHCESCGEPVIGSDGVSYKAESLTRFFHQRCFQCVICQTSLRGGTEFFVNNSAPHCVSCYQEKVLGCCDGCGLVLNQNGVVRAKNKKFHPGCFVCKKDGVRLDGRYYEKEGSFWCRNCYVDVFVPTCGSCGLKILSEQDGQPVTSIDWKGKKYHQQCFGCTDCKKLFVDLKAFQIDGNLYCKNCHSIRSKQ